MKFSIKDFFSICDQISRERQNWSQLLKKSITENLFFVCSICQAYLHRLITANASDSFGIDQLV